MTEKEKKGLITYFEKQAKSILGWTVPISEIPKERTDIAYTDGKGIFLNFTLADDFVIETEKKSFMTGLFAHELMHLLRTDFHIRKERLDIATAARKRVLATISNILEDSAIEACAHLFLPEYMVKSLMLMKQKVHEKSKYLTECQSAFEQYMSACMQLTNYGLLKGEMSFEKAKELFNETAPIYLQGMLEKSAKKRMEYSEQIVDIIKELWENNADVTKDMANAMGEKSVSSGSEEHGVQEMNGEPQPLPCGNLSEEEIQNLEESVVQLVEASTEIENYGRKERESSEAAPVIQPIRSGYFDGDKTKAVEIPASEIDGDAFMYDTVVRQNQHIIRAIDHLFSDALSNAVIKQHSKTGSRVDVKRLTKKPTSTKIFLKKTEQDLKDVAVFVLIDESGSMFGDKSKTARETAIILAEVFSKYQIPLYIMGFTDNRGTPKHYHYINWNNNSKEKRTKLAGIDGKVDNFDGYSIREATQILSKRKEKKKLLLILSDGQPASYGYKSERDGIVDTSMAIREARGKGIQVSGIGIQIRNDEDMRTMYGHGFINVQKTEELKGTVLKELKRTLLQ